MSSDDQVDTVEYLTRVVSMSMGLQEQLEIIRIINPNARVLPTDTEFVIGTALNTNYILLFCRLCLTLLYFFLNGPPLSGITEQVWVHFRCIFIL